VKSIRIATYNVHKCRGMDGRVRPERVAGVLRELDADILALQEVLSIEGGAPEKNQARFLAEQLENYSWHFGENRRLRGGAYGNVVLSRLPVRQERNYDLSCTGCERRGCLRVDVQLGGGVLHVFNLHLGTGLVERREQARKLVSEEVLKVTDIAGPRLVVGDFNEWTRGLTSKLMAQHFQTIDFRQFLRRRRTYPGLLPLLHLDNLYFDEGLALETFAVHRSRSALVASDHLPLVAEFRVKEAAQRSA
jgi:endonuclease/exonuclease/phosphatase family metal-dependent hydrolase